MEDVDATGRRLPRRERRERRRQVQLARRKLQPGWRHPLRRASRRQQLAARMIQRAYRSHLLRQAFQRTRRDIRFTFASLQAFRRARSRRRWRDVDLRRLSREELRLLALALGLPSTGKKVLLMCRLQRWVDQHVLAGDAAAQAAARALEARRRAQGCVYFCAARPDAAVVDVQPLRGQHLTSVAAGADSDAVYALDAARGAVWLCRTGGLASQVGLCSVVPRRDDLEPSPRESHWLATPVFLHTLRAEHVEHVAVARAHALAVARAGELFSWGDNAHGALGVSVESAAHVARNRAVVVGALANYQAVAAAAGGLHSAAVCDHVAGHHGVVFCWGSNSHGQLGLSPSRGSPSTSTGSSFPRAAVLHQVAALRAVRVRQVACGALHTLALASDGRVFSWGCSDGGRLGHGRPTASKRTTGDVGGPARVRGALEGLVVLAIACGAWHNACIAADAGHEGAGRVLTWGTGIYGQLGLGLTQVALEPQPLRLPPCELETETLATRLACGAHHTAALTRDNRVFTWGSTRAFHGTPTELRLPGGARLGRVASLACGRSFTVLNTLSRDAQSFEQPQVSRLWRDKPVVVPRLELRSLPAVPLSSSHPLLAAGPVRLEPDADRRAREAEELREAQRLEDVDVASLVHPLCRLCWRCEGFQPSPLRLWSCRRCTHERQLHGPRRPGVAMGEYEAVRKLQSLVRARRARRVLQRAREQRYQRVFSLSHGDFFYYNLWRGGKSWTRPVELSEDFEVPIRDPDASPRVWPPLTPQEAATKLQAAWRGARARRAAKSRLQQRYEKHFDLDKGRVYHLRRPVGTWKLSRRQEKEAVKLWEPPALLRRLYDLGEPVEIQRLARFAAMTRDEAARVVQQAYRCHRGREFLRRLLRSRLKKLWDAASGRYYYYNVVTKESSWIKPRLLCEEDEDDAEDEVGGHSEARKRVMQRRRALPPRREKFASEEAAARTIQALYRRFASRSLLLELLRRRYRKLLDPNSGCAYYYDRVNGTASWLKPAVLGEYDLELFDDSASGTASAATRRQSTLIAPMARAAMRVPRVSERARLKRLKRRLQRLRNLTRDEAAARLQRVWRARRAQDQLRSLLLDAYEKIYDPVTEHFYYYNRKTGVARWEKPTLLVTAEQDIRERRAVRRRRSHAVTADAEAREVLAAFVVCGLARLELLRRLHARIVKVFDPHTQQYYYFDKLTGQSSWKKPVTLRAHDLSPV